MGKLLQFRGKTGEVTKEAAIELTLHRRDTIRAFALEALSEVLPLTQLTPLLRRAIQDRSRHVRGTAARLCGEQCIRSLQPELIGQLLVERDALTLVHLLDSLASLEMVRGVASKVSKLLRHRDPMVRAYAADCVGRLGIKRLISQLRAAHEGEGSSLPSLMQAGALYALGASQFLDELETYLESADYTIRCATANTLKLYVRTNHVSRVLRRLRLTLQSERTVAGRACLKNTIAALNKRRTTKE
jgi:HEAT repeat protein